MNHQERNVKTDGLTKRINVNIISRELERQVQPQRHPHQDIIDLDNPPIKANVMQPTY